MLIMLWLCAAAALLELLIYAPSFVWRMRKVIAPIILAATVFSGSALAAAYPGVFTAILLALCLMRAFNMIRIIHGRMHEQYMRVATRRTGVVLIGVQVLVSVIWMLWHFRQVSGDTIWLVATLIQLGVAAVLLFSVLRSLRHTAWPPTEHHYTDSELPTLTIAVPARNETEALHACLERVIASDYPKLEVIVLDDCSQTRRTPEIIRGFAHEGVRFVPGEQPADTWLPKNQAYDRLVREASGEYVLFCGVDVRMEHDSIRKIVSTMLSRRKTMLSILPDRDVSVRAVFSPAQTLRYFWELVPPRRLFGKPPVLSSCWIVQKAALKKAGGFEAVRRSIVPEAYFARRLAGADQYGFMRAGSVLGISSVKDNTAQRETAVRVRYPQLHRRPEQVFILFSVELALFVLPFIVTFVGLWIGINGLAVAFAAAAVCMLMAVNALVVRATHISSALLGFIALPVVVLYDLCIMLYSMWRYELSVVDWKGRNVCVPAMHVIPRLPKID